MNQEGTIAASQLLDVSATRSFDLNQLIEELAHLPQQEHEHRNIVIILDLDKKLPKTSADRQQIECVVLALFTRARNAIIEAGSLYGTIAVCTTRRAGKVQFSITDEGVAERSPGILGPIFRRKPEDEINLTTCAEIVQDQGGELYAWRPHHPAVNTIVMDLPIAGAARML
jgi:signal transduction histidine kinase